jgi:hypothetical protein
MPALQSERFAEVMHKLFRVRGAGVAEPQFQLAIPVIEYADCLA